MTVHRRSGFVPMAAAIWLLFAPSSAIAQEVESEPGILDEQAASQEEEASVPPEEESPCAAAVIDDSLESLHSAGWRPVGEGETIHDLLDLGLGEKRPLLLMFRSEAELASHRLEQALTVDPRLSEVSARFVRVVADLGSETGRDLSSSLRVLTTPALLVFSTTGEESIRLGEDESPQEIRRSLAAVLDEGLQRSTLEEAAIGRPFDIHLAFEIGRLHALRGDSVGAKRHFARIFVLRRMLDHSSRALVRGAADAGRLGDSNDFGLIRSALEADLQGVPEEIDTLLASAYYALAEYVYLRDRSEPALALRIFDELMRRFPDSPEARRAGLSMALAHESLGSTRRAVSELARHRSISQDDPGELARTYEACSTRAPLVDWAIRNLPRDLKTHPGNAELHHAMARALEVSGELDQAVFHAQRAAELSPDWSWYRKELARLEASTTPSEDETGGDEADLSTADESTEPTSPDSSEAAREKDQ